MPRNISFMLTTDQIRNQSKTVTRRKGWKFLKVGDILNACVQCQGLKPGEKIERLGTIQVVDVRQEPLAAMLVTDYGNNETKLEGFPHMTGKDFVGMFCDEMKSTLDQHITRIEFSYINPQGSNQ